jgi:hypothetical protein
LNDRQLQNPSYHARMLIIQRWRRIALISCALVAIYAGVIYLRDPSMRAASGGLLIASLFAFIAAMLVAVNFLTVKFRK